eukprot:COSAG05_NODE_17447_length_325_cov_0.685841_1_plen_74_part_01
MLGEGISTCEGPTLRLGRRLTQFSNESSGCAHNPTSRESDKQTDSPIQRFRDSDRGDPGIVRNELKIIWEMSGK